MTAPRPPGQDHLAQQTEYLRRAAHAAEATRRNSRILVVALVAIPVAAVVAAGIVLIVSTASTKAVAAQERAGIAAVEDAARSVSYTPPAYTTIGNQVRGICENLETKGMTTTQAALAMVTGFGEGMGVDQATAIVEAADREVC